MRQAVALPSAVRVSRIFCTVDIIIPGVNIGISSRERCCFHQALGLPLGLHRITHRCPPGGSAASPRHQPAASRNTATAAASSTLNPEPCTTSIDVTSPSGAITMWTFTLPPSLVCDASFG
jgi:hypothetical protein